MQPLPLRLLSDLKESGCTDGPTITAFYSTDLQTWRNGTAFHIANSTEVGFGGMCNNAVTRLDTPKGEPPAYVMAIESNMGKEYLQATFACATCHQPLFVPPPGSDRNPRYVAQVPKQLRPEHGMDAV